MRLNNQGQTLVEVIVVITVGILVTVALVFATISSLRNSEFAKNQAQATKLAQEGIEKVRSTRDRGDPIGGNFSINSVTIDSWQDPDLWTQQISPNCQPNCYFKFSGAGFQFITAASDIGSWAEDPLGDGKFKRVVVLSDDPGSYPDRKEVSVIVGWNDFSGDHQSRLTTIFRKL